MPDDPIRTRPRPACPVCGGSGPVLFAGEPDRLFGVPGVWTSRRCAAAGCGTVWLDPCPVDADIPKLYRTYYTHAPAGGPDPVSRVWGWLARRTLPVTLGYPGRWSTAGRLAAAVGPLREGLDGSVLWLPGDRPGRLLDVGCGDGRFLATMRGWGWQVTGVEPDPAAAAVARGRGLDVRAGDLADAGLPAGGFDAVTLSHVLEHLPDPVGTLRACGRLLRPGGRLHAVTPNAAGDGAARFGRFWRGWETPRHLQVFTAGSLAAAATAAGLTRVGVRTPARLGWVLYRVSERLTTLGELPGGRCLFQPWRLPPAVLFHLAEYRRSRRRPAGEELLLTAEGPP